MSEDLGLALVVARHAVATSKRLQSWYFFSLFFPFRFHTKPSFGVIYRQCLSPQTEQTPAFKIVCLPQVHNWRAPKNAPQQNVCWFRSSWPCCFRFRHQKRLQIVPVRIGGYYNYRLQKCSSRGRLHLFSLPMLVFCGPSFGVLALCIWLSKWSTTSSPWCESSSSGFSLHHVHQDFANIATLDRATSGHFSTNCLLFPFRAWCWQQAWLYPFCFAHKNLYNQKTHPQPRLHGPVLRVSSSCGRSYAWCALSLLYHLWLELCDWDQY